MNIVMDIGYWKLIKTHLAVENYLKTTDRFPPARIQQQQHKPKSEMEMADPKLIAFARSELDVLTKKPARTADEK